jgi:hypothetical protein
MRLPVIGTDDQVSPTAHYTGYVWARNGLSHPELRTLEGRVLFESLRPVMTLNSILGRGSLEQYLLARHQAIDRLLEQAVERDGITQVVEIAAGLSARGWRFASRYPELTYVEADLTDMADRKRRSLAESTAAPSGTGSSRSTPSRTQARTACPRWPMSSIRLRAWS